MLHFATNQFLKGGHEGISQIFLTLLRVPKNNHVKGFLWSFLTPASALKSLAALMETQTQQTSRTPRTTLNEILPKAFILFN